MTGSTQPAETRVVEKKRAILEAAATVFRRHGLHRAGMREIAEAAGMTVGNLYYYFENKQAILAFCQQDALASLLDLAQRVVELPLGADSRLYLLIVGHVLRLNETTPGALAHLEVEALDERWRPAILEQRGRYEEAIRSTIETGIADGVFRPCDPKVAALAILGAVNWTVKWFRAGGDRSAREIGEAFAEQLVSGLLADDARLEAPDSALVEPGEEDPAVALRVSEAGRDDA